MRRETVEDGQGKEESGENEVTVGVMESEEDSAEEDELEPIAPENVVNDGELHGEKRSWGLRWRKSSACRKNEGHRKIGISLKEFRRMRGSSGGRQSYRGKRGKLDEFAAGRRKKRSALHGTGASKWYEAKNWYYSFLDWSWWYVFLFVTMLYFLACILWSLVTWSLADQIECEVGEFSPGSFGIASVFATSNILTLGYGPCLPTSYEIYTLACVQQYSGILLSVIVLSVVVSKFQIPKPDIVFSKRALVCTRNGQPVLLIRVGNRRVNLLYETRVSLAALRFRRTFEGEHYVEYLPLKVSFPPTMTAVATVVHRINWKSPLRQILLDQDLDGIAFSVSFGGHDSIYHDELSCTTQYRGSDLILGGVLFDDMMDRPKNGKGLRANFDKFDNIKLADNVRTEDLLEALGAVDQPPVSAGSVSATHIERTRSSSDFSVASGDDSGSLVQFQKTVQLQQKEDIPILSNDVTLETVLMTPPRVLDPAIVYLCYGNIRCGKHLVRVCPYSRLVFMFLVESGITFEVIDIDWDKKPTWFLELNPSGRTPFLHAAGKWVQSSREIIRVLNKSYPEQGASINRAHNLPVSAFSFFELLENYGFPLALSSTENLTEMIRLPRGDSRCACSSLCIGSGKKQKTNSKWSSIKNQRMWKEAPPGNTRELYLAVAVKHRGDQLTRFCSDSQSIEWMLRFLGIHYHAVFVDVDNKPKWIDGPCPILFGPVAEDGGPRITTGADKIIELLEKVFKDDKILHLPTKLGCTAALELEKSIHLRVAEYILYRDQQRKSAMEKLLESVQDMLDFSTHSPGEKPVSWKPLFCGEEIGLDDFILAPRLRKSCKFLLEHLGGYKLGENGFSTLERYVNAVSNTQHFRDTTLTSAPATFYASNTLRFWLADKHETEKARIEALTGTLEQWEKNEEATIKMIFGEGSKDSVVLHPDGSLTFENGLSGPAFEMDTVYLAVGGVKRGDEIVKICPYSRVLEMILNEAGIPFQSIIIDLLNKPAWFIAASNGKAPNLYWNGAWFSESSFILNKLLGLFPCELSHMDAPVRLQFDDLENKSKMDLFNAADNICEAYLTADEDDRERPAKKLHMVKFLQTLETRLATPGQGSYLSGGRSPVIDDIALVCSIWRIVKVSCAWFHGFNFHEEGLPNVFKWLQTFESRQSFTYSIPKFPEPFLIYYNAKFNGNKLIKMTPIIERNEKDAVSKSRLASSIDGQASNLSVLAQFESLLGVVEDLLENGDGPFLCGALVGLADILAFSLLRWFQDSLQSRVEYNFKDRGFPNISEFIELVGNMARFRSVLSPAAIELVRIHIADRLGISYPHLVLNREEKEHLELIAAGKVEAHIKRMEFRSKKESGPLSVSSGNSSSRSNGSQEFEKRSIDDLLFCI